MLQSMAKRPSDSMRIRLTDEGRQVRDLVAELFARHASKLDERVAFGGETAPRMINDLKTMERFWTDQIRYIY